MEARPCSDLGLKVQGHPVALDRIQQWLLRRPSLADDRNHSYGTPFNYLSAPSPTGMAAKWRAAVSECPPRWEDPEMRRWSFLAR